jgi:hypothetical protein
LPRWQNYVDKSDIRERYGLPLDATIFIIGGNIGKPQGSTFLIDVAMKMKENKYITCPFPFNKKLKLRRIQIKDK